MAVLVFESFDAAGADERGPSPDYEAGYADGLAEAARRAEAEEARLSEALVQAVSEAGFGFVEARRHLLAGLAPLFAAIGEKFLPALAQEALVIRLADALAEAAATDTMRPIRLAVHPSRVEPLRAALAGALAMPLEVGADPGLGRDAARWDSAAGETALDLGALVSDIAGILAGLTDEIERTWTHE